MYIFTYSLKLNYFVLVLKLKKYLWKLMREVFMKKVHQCFVHYEVFVYGDNMKCLYMVLFLGYPMVCSFPWHHCWKQCRNAWISQVIYRFMDRWTNWVIKLESSWKTQTVILRMSPFIKRCQWKLFTINIWWW